jgi:hypothetical protein
VTSTGSDASSGGSGSPYQSTFSFEEDVSPTFPLTPAPIVRPQHARSRSNILPYKSAQVIDPALTRSTPQNVTSAGSLDGPSYFQSPAGLPTSAPYSQTQFQNTLDVRSHSASEFDTFGPRNAGFTSVNVEMPPPQGSADSSTNRHTYGSVTESPATILSDSYSPNTGSPTPYSPYMYMPLTPISVGSEEPVTKTAPIPQTSVLSPPDLRRVSVQSLINDLPSDGSRPYSGEVEHGRQYPITDLTYTTYGYDLGLPDLDTSRNDDFSAIAIFSPQSDIMDLDSNTPYGRAETRGQDMAFESGGYYAKPVPIRISKQLEPLPPLLMENQMNLLYFHHFLNHTARILVPHDCERNPFRQILPESECIKQDSSQA